MLFLIRFLNSPSVYRGGASKRRGRCFSLRPANFVSKRSAELFFMDVAPRYAWNSLRFTNVPLVPL